MTIIEFAEVLVGFIRADVVTADRAADLLCEHFEVSKFGATGFIDLADRRLKR